MTTPFQFADTAAAVLLSTGFRPVYSPYVSVTYTPSSISARVSYHGHFHEHGHYRGQKHALHQQTLDHYSTQPAV
ncbi:hypothetical protein CDN97_21740 [Pantoea sp. AMG 501]|nr:hypothetical protein CDN97_21740 [Pantoea sp. AMG 501]